MSLARSLNRYLDALAYARTALHPAVVLPLAIFCAVQLLIVLLLAWFTEPLVAPVMVPAMRLLGGEQALHYPLHLVGLPSVYQRIYLPLVAIVGFSLWSLAVWKLVDRHPLGSERGRRDFRPSLPHIVVIGVLFVGASVATGEASARIIGARTPELVERAVWIVSMGLTTVLQALLVYAPLVLRIRGGNFFNAIVRGASYARRHYAATAFMIVTVLLIHLPVDFLLSRADRIAARFHPETVLQVMIGSIVLEMFTAYILFAGITELAFPREGGIR
jgi:hypothetical protein